jgi:uncharacterized protein DUF955
MCRKILLLCATLWVGVAGLLPEGYGQDLRLRIGRTTNGFHIPQQWQGRTIIVIQPENEHVVHSIEDMFAAAGLPNDVFVGQTNGINNAFAVIDRVGGKERRLIVVDLEWTYSSQKSYRVILAHELGHHVCRHTLDRYNANNRWQMEFEADRAGGALLRKSYADGQGSIGGGIVDLTEIIATIRQLGPGSQTHPASEMRVKAFIEGWQNGSPCLEAGYTAINPWPEPDPKLIARISRRYRSDMHWCFFGAELVQIGPCLARHPRVRTEIDGNQLRIVILRPNSVAVTGEFPPDYRQTKPGSLLFSGSSDSEKIKGTFWHHVSGCNAVAYEVEGSFVENNGIYLVGQVPRMKGCQVVGSFAKTLHFFKNVTDILQ